MRLIKFLFQNIFSCFGTSFSILEHHFPVFERLFPLQELPFPVFLFFWEGYFVPGRDGTEEFVPGHLLLPLSRDKGTPGREFFFVPGQRDNGTSHPGLSRDVPRDVPSPGNSSSEHKGWVVEWALWLSQSKIVKKLLMFIYNTTEFQINECTTCLKMLYLEMP